MTDPDHPRRWTLRLWGARVAAFFNAIADIILSSFRH